jgi:IS1 family transposase
MRIRATCRITGVARQTVNNLLLDLGRACSDYQDAVLRNLDVKRVEADEIWAFVGSKDKNVPADKQDDPNYGSVWTWTALDADTKLMISWLVGDRTTADCFDFMADLRDRIKVANRIQLTTDGLSLYPPVVDALWRNGIDYAQVVKEYKNVPIEEARRYSPATCSSIQKIVVCGDPDERLVSTSYVERQNLTMRMSMRRFTRLTNAHSKGIEQHAAAVALHFLYYNFVRPHESLGKRVTPAMAAGVESRPWTLFQIAELLESN